ncbi:hypothetical protein [Hyalangium rubrum]|uniref:Lipoprotein n=1 Tax=Hyalangium rubrum TaxID=3103134 RepID=A0ABU5GU77_9BACT|nr:hypothetical protein [Hyalangium sp. s54d21]MDY7224749.1 hypothetical protein [Hyalangium sp. s54d21]
MVRSFIHCAAVIVALQALGAAAAPGKQRVQEPQGGCPYSSVLARVQSTMEDSWKRGMTVSLGQSFRVGGLDTQGKLAEQTAVDISIRDAAGGPERPVSNGQAVVPPKAGEYVVTVRCGDQADTARVTVAACTQDDWEASTNRVLPARTIASYRDESSWRGSAWPTTHRRKCERPQEALHLYWIHPFASDPSHRDQLRLRYVGSNPDCARAVSERGGALEYLSDGKGANNVHVVGRGPYLRVALNGKCLTEASSFMLVWP